VVEFQRYLTGAAEHFQRPGSLATRYEQGAHPDQHRGLTVEPGDRLRLGEGLRSLGQTLDEGRRHADRRSEQRIAAAGREGRQGRDLPLALGGGLPVGKGLLVVARGGRGVAVHQVGDPE
jgi:hypothetical protein